MVGRTAKDVQKKDWKEYVRGFVLGIDFTNTRYKMKAQAGRTLWSLSKAHDMSMATQIGFTSLEDVVDVQNLQLVLKKNDETVQEGNTKDMILKVPELLEQITKYCTLQEGDIIYTGCPGASCKIKVDDDLEAFLYQQKGSENVELANLEFSVVDKEKSKNRRDFDAEYMRQNNLNYEPDLNLQPRCFGAAKNYFTEAKKTDPEMKLPSYPLIFSKSLSMVKREEKFKIPWFSQDDAVNFEVELGVMMNEKKASEVKHWTERVAGYCLLIDYTDRIELAAAGKVKNPVFLSKVQDNFLSLSEFIDKDDIKDPYNVLLELRINGELK
jgi:2-keto-4-pentenoate hydratase/2-oxohepta-3-ene-1,7-dioic acid hydratase in catechol pathway